MTRQQKVGFVRRKLDQLESCRVPAENQQGDSPGDSSGSACWACLQYVIVTHLCHLCLGGKRSNRQYRNGNRLHEQASKPWNKDIKKI